MARAWTSPGQQALHSTPRHSMTSHRMVATVQQRRTPWTAVAAAPVDFPAHGELPLAFVAQPQRPLFERHRFPDAFAARSRTAAVWALWLPAAFFHGAGPADSEVGRYGRPLRSAGGDARPLRNRIRLCKPRPGARLAALRERASGRIPFTQRASSRDASSVNIRARMRSAARTASRPSCSVGSIIVPGYRAATA
jgi:hypothetical protein